MEQSPNVTSIELDKYKLLVSESDVIVNLLLKLSHKMANAENSIKLFNAFNKNVNMSFNEELVRILKCLNCSNRKIVSFFVIFRKY